jgi:curved DNA-binding protein CbpA
MRGKIAKDIRRKAAQERQAAYDKLSIEEKIAKMDKKLGVGQGGKKERAKLQAQLERRNEKKEVVEKTKEK